MQTQQMFDALLPNEKVIEAARALIQNLEHHGNGSFTVYMWDDLRDAEFPAEMPADVQLTVLHKKISLTLKSGECQPEATALLGLGEITEISHATGVWDAEFGFLRLYFGQDFQHFSEDWVLRSSFNAPLPVPRDFPLPDHVWVLQDAKTLHVIGVFWHWQEAQKKVDQYGLLAYVTQYPANQLPYEWVQNMGYMHMNKPRHQTREFIQNFPTRFQSQRLLKPQRKP